MPIFLDLPITLAVQSINNPAFDTLMRFISFLGDTPQNLILLATAIGYFLLQKKIKNALLVLASTSCAFLISGVLKPLIGRPRPDPELVRQAWKFAENDSFPSGHVLFYTGFFGMLTYLTYCQLQHSKIKTVLIIVFCLLIALSGLSRIYLGAHWFTDTLGGYVLGILWIALVVKLARHGQKSSLTRQKQKQQPGA